MPTVTTDAVRSDGVTLVQVHVRADRRQRVHLAVRCDGPVWSPRATGAAATGDPGVLTVEVAAGPSGTGFATPAPPSAVDVAVVGADPVDDGLPAGIRGWLESVEERVGRAERVARAEDLAAATEAVAAAGGLGAVDRLAAELDRDRRLLNRVSFAPDRLCERVEAVDLPLESLSAVAGTDRCN